MIKAFIIIPAKGDSKRLVGKNKKIIAGKTLLEHSIIYAKQSKLAETIIVSTEDRETKEIAKLYGVKVVGRHPSLMGETEVADVYIELFKTYSPQTLKTTPLPLVCNPTNFPKSDNDRPTIINLPKN